MIQLATFEIDVTPPLGHSLCAGWYQTAIGIDDPLFASGVILINEDGPVVLLSIDWSEMSNRSHLRWRQALAEAVGTTPDRVVVHCTHAHCTPWPDEYAQTLVEDQEGVLPIMDVAWCNAVVQRLTDAAREAMARLQPVTALGTGRAKVDQIASNRRIMGENGKVKAVRWTRTYDPAVRAEPEGLIDPWMKTISFWNGDAKLAVLHYYAVHPTSYEDENVTSEFTGIARARRQAEDNGVPHLYFTECAGNITAGKYNDGNRANRELFTERIHQGMVESESNSEKVPVDNFQWRTAPLSLPPREDMNEPDLLAKLHDSELPSGSRSRAALMLAYLERAELPITVAALHFGDAVSVLHLPAEAFIEYQLFAQQQRPGSFVTVPAYGDCGPGYICMENSAEEGGYEPNDAFCASRSEPLLKSAIVDVMR